MKKILNSVLKKIKPSQQETACINESAAKIIKKLKNKGHRAVLVGSAGRGTYIAGDKDLDIFVFFPKTVSREKLEKTGLALGKQVLGKNSRTHYAEHPYVKGTLCGFEIEIVPCYEMKIGEKPLSAVDRSPLHHKHVLKHLTKKQRDDVLFLKQFLKGAGAYGAEHRVKGFSGYLCELLILKHSSFERVLRAAHAFDHPFILIDPVDANRNVAAAVSKEKLADFKKKAAAFLKKPSENFFFPKQKPVLHGFDLKKTVTVTMPAPRVIEEIQWSQLEKLRTALEKQLALAGFEVRKTKHWTNEKTASLLAFEFASLRIPEKTVHVGPFAADEKNAAAFKAKNKNWFVKNKRLYARRKREFTNAEKFLKHALKTMDVPSHFRNAAKKAKFKQL